MLEETDLVLAIGQREVALVRRRFAGLSVKVHALPAYAGGAPSEEGIADPYGQARTTLLRASYAGFSGTSSASWSVSSGIDPRRAVRSVATSSDLVLIDGELLLRPARSHLGRSEDVAATAAGRSASTDLLPSVSGHSGREKHKDWLEECRADA